jgi:thiosulfate/3-mercaptopyruvate sulfurtransferase
VSPRARASQASPLVTPEWLARNLTRRDVRIVDGSWHMPQLKRDARAEFAAAHIPGAVFFDIDAIADHATSLPHMLPSAREFARTVGGLGIGARDRVIVYDTRGVASAARVWWTFRAFGHDAVAVLDGGLPRWRAEGRPVESGTPAPRPRKFTARLRRSLVRDLAAMRRNVTTRKAQVLDARSRGRFAGTEPEPRAGLRSGHIPGSLNLPYDELYQKDGTLLPPHELRAKFEAAGLDLGKPVVTSCGSGVTASVLALGLYAAGRPDVAVYDGSWTEWGGRADTPIET